MPDPRRKGRRAYKIEGENLVYFSLHKMITGTFFIIITLISGMWRVNSLSDVFSSAFLALIGFLIAVYITTGLVGRITTYTILHYYARYNRKSIKTFWNINKGINSVGIKWFTSIIIKSFLFAFGIVVLLQNAIYGSETIYTLIASYIIIEIIVSGLLRLIFYLRG